MDKKFKKELIITLSCFILLTILFLLGVFSNVNSKITDNIYGGHEPLESIVIVGIDDASLQSIGRWPWARGNFTQLIKKLTDAKAVGIDVGFFERSSYEEDA